MKFKQWEKFESGDWQHEINVRDFIQRNYTPYEGNSDFLKPATEKTKKLWDEVLELYKKEHEAKGGVLDIDTKTVSTVSAHEAGYIDKDLEEIVGLQTDAPLKRAIMPFGGIRIVEKSCEAYDREVDPEVDKIFHTIRKTHNDGVFSVYTPDIRSARSSHLITGLPDGYGRGRIIGDYRRVALYGVDVLIGEKKEELEILDTDEFTQEIIREREEIKEQIDALEQLKVMAQKYGFDISNPASNAKEAVQWLYFGYLGAIKDQNGALAVMNSIAKLPFEQAEDGISYTFSITPGTLGKTEDERVTNMVNMLDGYFKQTGHHINVNVFDRSLLLDAMDHPEKYPQLTIRVSGYAVNFTKLTREQQLDVINRTIHEKI